MIRKNFIKSLDLPGRKLPESYWEYHGIGTWRKSTWNLFFSIRPTSLHTQGCVPIVLPRMDVLEGAWLWDYGSPILFKLPSSARLTWFFLVGTLTCSHSNQGKSYGSITIKRFLQILQTCSWPQMKTLLSSELRQQHSGSLNTPKDVGVANQLRIPTYHWHNFATQIKVSYTECALRLW